MTDLAIKVAILGIAGWMLTRETRPQHATAAHALWLLILVSPIILVVVNWIVSPMVLVAARSEAIGSLSAYSERLRNVGLIAYGLVASSLLVRVAGGLIAVRRLMLDSRSLQPADLMHLRGLAQSADLNIREGNLHLPVTAGVWKPVVILPREWKRMTSAELRAILLHEAAHVRRRDCATAIVCAVAEALFWFHPVVWVASARVRWFAEMACDDDASRRMERRDYASSLLTLAAAWTTARRPHYAVTAGAESGVGQRIRLLLDDIDVHRPGRVRLVLACAGLVAAVSLSAYVRFTATSLDSGTRSGYDHRFVHELRHGSTHF